MRSMEMIEQGGKSQVLLYFLHLYSLGTALHFARLSELCFPTAC